ncbi:hypothetical protein AAFN60_06515 [Roseibacillus persicicus]|uniref:hypothetical protein n=1 Tax=Roseibacillus persicicus TaxID=454148 RepID=UPI00398AF804
MSYRQTLLLVSFLLPPLSAQQVDTYPNIRSVGSPEGVFFDGTGFQIIGSKMGLASSDGIRWESGPTLPSSARHVAQGGGVTVAISTNRINYSTDGVTWNSASHGASATFQEIAYGNGVFAISLDDGSFLTSPDGSTWVARTGLPLQGSVVIRDFQFIHGSFYVTGFGPFLYRSTDGITWTEVDSPITSTNSFALTAVGNQVGVFALDEGYLFDPASPDDGDFYEYGAFTGIQFWYEAAAGNDLIVLAGYDGRYALSQDFGQTFTLSLLDTPEDFESVAFANGAFLLVDKDGRAFRSVDGVNWTQVMEKAPGTNYLSLPIIHDGEQFITKGEEGIALSPEGVSWTNSSQVGSATTISGIAYANDYYVVLGSEGSIATGTDPLNLAERRSSASVNPRLSAAAYGGGRWVAVGALGSAWYSSNGQSWLQSGMPNSETYEHVAYGNGIFLACGDDLTKAATSTNGINWTAVTTNQTARIERLQFLGGHFVSVRSGYLYTSLDGITWDRSEYLSERPEVIAYDELLGQFILGHDNGYLISDSLDGPWERRTLPEGYDFNAISAKDGLILLRTSGQVIATFSHVPFDISLSKSSATRDELSWNLVPGGEREVWSSNSLEGQWELLNTSPIVEGAERESMTIDYENFGAQQFFQIRIK